MSAILPKHKPDVLPQQGQNPSKKVKLKGTGQKNEAFCQKQDVIKQPIYEP